MTREKKDGLEKEEVSDDAEKDDHLTLKIKDVHDFLEWRMSVGDEKVWSVCLQSVCIMYHEYFHCDASRGNKRDETHFRW